MKYWEAIKHVCEHPEDNAVTDGWWIGIDRDGDLIHRRANGSIAHRYILPVVRNADWQIKSAWTECSQEAALDKLQGGGYVVETQRSPRVEFDWRRVKIGVCDDIIFYDTTGYVSINKSRRWRYRKEPAK